MIIHNDIADLSVAAHAIKSVLDIKFTRAKERHAVAMGFASSNHLLAALKEGSVQQEFDAYIKILQGQVLANHQIKMDEELIERLRFELMD